ncbi:MAG: glycosyltransferase family 87 protein [Acetobacteraceae bacterium]
MAEPAQYPATRPGFLAFIALASLAPGLRALWGGWQDFPGSLFVWRQLVVRDYINIWAGGHLAAQGRLDLVFHPLEYAAWLNATFGDRLDLHNFGYPPHLLLLAVPLAAIGLVPGFFVWVIGTSALLWGVLRAGGLGGWAAAAVVVSPAALENILIGQNGALLAGAALGGGLLLAGRSPILAGALLGLLTLKPQLGLLVPVCLLAGREFRCLAWTAAFGAAYCVAGLLVFGLQPWLDYVTIVLPFTRGYIDAGFGLASHYIMVPPFIVARAAGAGLATAYAIQGAASLACAVAVAWAWRRRNVDRRAAVALALCLAPLATPYSHAYDLVAVAIACVLLVRLELERGGISARAWLCLAPAWMWPSLALVTGLLLAPGLGTPSLLLAAALAVHHLRRPAGITPSAPPVPGSSSSRPGWCR